MISNTEPRFSQHLAGLRAADRLANSDLSATATKAGAPAVRKELYGSFSDLGVEIIWHDFNSEHPWECSGSFRPQSLELCLNLSGRGAVRARTGLMQFDVRTAGFYVNGKSPLNSSRQAQEQHQFLTVKFSSEYLDRLLAACDGSLHPLVEKFLRCDAPSSGLGEIAPLSLEHKHLVEQLLRPPVYQGARQLWYQSKVLQLIVDFCFARRDDDELFCDRQKRLARERVSRVITLLRERLADPPGLEEIGRLVGCSPFYLSRTFSAETHMTIPQYLRQLRMERAAELLRTGRFNVTEVALEVGYSSLSHFSQAFCQVIGCCPALYPLGVKQASAKSS
jgi:AraC-like DNA-binding protein